MDDERVFLTKEEVDAKLQDGEEVHTFMQAGLVLLGCDMRRSRILDLVSDERPAELAGGQAASMGHGVVIWNDDGDAIFCQTKKEALKP